jgi:hypothetical protein
VGDSGGVGDSDGDTVVVTVAVMVVVTVLVTVVVNLVVTVSCERPHKSTQCHQYTNTHPFHILHNDPPSPTVRGKRKAGIEC